MIESGSLPRRHYLALAVIGTALLLQFVVPAVQLAGEGNQRWGWQMYSRELGAFGTYRAVMGDGAERPIRIRNHVHRVRPEMRPSAALAAQLCDRESDAVMIRVRYRNSDRVDEFPCGD